MFHDHAVAVLRALRERVALHLRAHQLSASTIFQIAVELQSIAAESSASLLINDRVDVALTARAHGVHLGRRSLPIPVARRLIGHGLIGYSAHGEQECVAAERDGADFVFVGSIYPTASHPDRTPGGIALLERCVAAGRKPVLAIGGVTAENAAEVRAAGAHGAAVIRAVWDAPRPVQAAEELARLLER